MSRVWFTVNCPNTEREGGDVAPYEEIARDLRGRLDAAEWQPGDLLPSVRTLAGDYQVDINTANKAVNRLAQWGYVRIREKTRTVVRDRSVPLEPLPVGQSIGYHPRWGYLYNPAAGDWAPIGTPDRAWVQVDHEVADLLEVPPGTRVLTRHRVVGPPDGPAQTTTTYFSPSLSERLDVDDTGPGGWMQRVEQADGPLRWRCAVSANLAGERAARDLDVAEGSPVLVLSFPITAGRSRTPVAVDVMTFDARRFRAEHPVPRSAAARYPPTPATGRNAPLPERD